MKILSINASNQNIGGAARIAVDLHSMYSEKCSGSSMLVGKMTLSTASTRQLPRSLFRRGFAKLLANDFSFYGSSDVLHTEEFRQAEIVHCHNLNGWYFNLNQLVAMARIKPVVWTLHDMWAMTPHSGHTDSSDIRFGMLKCSDHSLYPTTLWNNDLLLAYLKSKILRSANVTLVYPCQWLRDKARDTVLGDKHSVVINNGIKTQIFAIQDVVSSAEMRAVRALRKVLMVAADPLNNVYKGFSYFQKVAGMLKDKKIKFLALGGARQELVKNVEIIPATGDRLVIAKHLFDADVLVLPSKHEVFPLVVLEALAAGIPVVAFDVGGVREVIDGLPGCKVVPQGDVSALSEAILAVLRDVGSAQVVQAADRSAAVTERYSLQTMYSGYIQLFSSLLGSRI